MDINVDGDEVKRHRDRAGNDRGDEQRYDELLGQDGVQHHDYRRRDQHAECAAGGDAAGR